MNDYTNASVSELDRAYDVASNARRRFVIRRVAQQEETTVGELAESLAAMELGTDADDLTGQERKRIYISLHQSHLPKLDAYGVVRWDRDRGTVAEGSETERLAAALDRFEGRPPGRKPRGCSVLRRCIRRAVQFG